MIKSFIPQQDIKGHHPKGMISHTDHEYTQLASDLLERIKACNVTDLTTQERHDMAVNLALYYEDVLADAGIWRAFTDKMRAFYGKPLPFYGMDDDDYFADEPHFEDVQFIIWHTMVNSRIANGKISNPETPAILELTNKLFPYMDELFEELPVNEELKDFFERAAFMDDFYQQRDVLKWLSFDCYLTAIPNYKDHLLEKAKQYGYLYDGSPYGGLYIAESVIPYEERIGPLALTSQQWLGLIMRANDNKKEAEWAEQQQADDFGMYRIVKKEVGKGVTIEDEKGQMIFVSTNDFCNLTDGGNGCKMVIGSFVRYRDKWYPNSDSAWLDNGLEQFEKLKTEAQQQMIDNGDAYDRLLEQSGGNPFFYFANRQELVTFLKEHFSMPDNQLNDLGIPVGTNLALGLNGRHKGFAIMLKAASCLYDKRNPLYDKAKAKAIALEVAMNMPASLLSYAMEHNMLPDAALKSIYGEERGKVIFQDNYDFLHRAIMRDEYVE